jgi:eukaryotic-like serine/threonine-protein kinase
MAEPEMDPHGGVWTACLAPGRVLASRYRIVSFLGRGAVGEVYEAEDLELGGKIAVKVLPPEIAADERVLQRFKREIQLARRVTHPNVCRVFDLVHHRGEEGPGAPAERLFLTMELLRGETLEQRLARQGRLTTAEALPVIGHIAGALEAAHTNGVVHRDLKSGNVFLVPTASGLRAVVTDFGLAWSTVHEETSVTLTATGEMVGSPAYMAPEQVRGEEATPATDIYAFGVVMFEMITGELPFVGKSAFYTALKRLQEPAPSPRVHLSDLDLAWETTILRCLEREPADRFKTVRHVVRSLGATKAEESATSPLVLVHGRRRRGLPWQLVPAALLAVAALVSALWLFHGGPFASRAPDKAVPAETAAVPVALRPSVAVLPFDNLSDAGESAWSFALCELLPLELAATGELRVISPEQVDRAVRDLSSSNPANLPASAVPHLRERLGADFLVSGTFLAAAGRAPSRYDVLVRDARSGRTIATFTGEEALDSLGRRLRTTLGAGALSAVDEEALRATLPGPEVAALYGEALDRLRRFEARTARGLLEKAVAIQPDQPLLRSALATAWQNLGYRQEASRQANQAFALASALRREDWLALEARYHEVVREWDAAATSYAQILEISPDEIEAGLRLAAVQVEDGKNAEAVATLERLRHLPAPLGEDPRIDLAAAKAAGARRDLEQQRKTAERGIAKAEARGDRQLAAEARLQQADALAKLRDFKAAAEALSSAKQAFAAAHNPRGTAEAIRALAGIHAQEGRIAEARAAYDEMIRIYRSLGAEEDVVRGLGQTANLYLAAGELEQAEGFYRQTLDVAHKIGDRRNEAKVLHNLAKLTWQRGRLAEAKGFFLRVLPLHREIGYTEGEGASLQGLGTIAMTDGDLLDARKYYRQALNLYQRSGLEAHLAEVYNDLAEVSFALGELPQCRRQREEARKLAAHTHQEQEEARALHGLAAVVRQEGDLEAALDLLQRALGLYHQLDLPQKQASIQDDIGVTLTHQGELMEALKRFQPALAGARQQEDRRGEAATLTHQGRAILRFGEARRALAAQQRSVELSRTLQEPALLAETLVGLGQAQCALADLTAAQQSFTEALAIFRRRGEPGGVAAAGYGLGEALSRQGDLEQARKRHEEALAIRTRIGETLAAAESRLALAALASRQGLPAQAEAAARREVEAFRKLANEPGEAAATLLLARTLLAQGRKAAARDVLRSAAHLLDTSQEPAVRKAAAELR